MKSSRWAFLRGAKHLFGADKAVEFFFAQKPKAHSGFLKRKIFLMGFAGNLGGIVVADMGI